MNHRRIGELLNSRPRRAGTHVSSGRRWRRGAARVLAAAVLWATADRTPCRAEVDAGLIETRVRFDPNLEVILVPVSFNSKSRCFFVDTGATLSAFDSSLREELGKPLRTAAVNIADGRMNIELFKAPAATLGGRALSGVTEVFCLDLSSFRAATGSEFYGIVGMDFLAQRILRIDFDRGEVTFLRAVPSDSGQPLPLSWSAAGLRAKITIARLGTFPFVVDTGCLADAVMERELFRRLINDRIATAVITAPAQSAGERHEGREAVVPDVSLENFHHSALLGEGDSNLLGVGCLSRYVVTIDFPAKTMYLKPGKGFGRPMRWNLSGAFASRIKGITAVIAVTRDGPADRAGVRVGDVIEQIDSVPSGSLTLKQLHNLLCEPGNHKMRCTRDAVSFDVVLDLKEVTGATSRSGNAIRNDERH
jgi:hypothetical protein